jgi:hypothetical protein
MTLPVLPSQPDRGALIDVVAWLISGQGAAEEDAVVCSYLDGHLPDPNWSDIIFFPTQHAIAAQRGLSEFSAKQVVEIAYEYRPIVL